MSTSSADTSDPLSEQVIQGSIGVRSSRRTRLVIAPELVAAPELTGAPELVAAPSNIDDSEIRQFTRMDKTTWLQSKLNHDPLYYSTLSTPILITPCASNRLYYRFKLLKSNETSVNIITHILMDVDPEKNSIESTKQFIDIAKLFKDFGLNVPFVYSIDFRNGYLIVSDLGDLTYFDFIQQNQHSPTFNLSELYKSAVDSMFKLQIYTREDILPDFCYDRQLFMMSWFKEWYLQKHLNKSCDELNLSLTFQIILDNLKKQEKVFIHYDYHSLNLIYNKENNTEPGIVDFQDAQFGPICYDLASLLHDCYINLKEDFIQEILEYYWNNAKICKIKVNPLFSDFCRDFEFTSLQRCIKSIGLFSRLFYHMNNDHYLQYIPVLINRCKSISSKYPELNGLYEILLE
jgi:aminoglycoside/choline kinase family phosphotransferase